MVLKAPWQTDGWGTSPPLRFSRWDLLTPGGHKFLYKILQVLQTSGFSGGALQPRSWPTPAARADGWLRSLPVLCAGRFPSPAVVAEGFIPSFPAWLCRAFAPSQRGLVTRCRVPSTAPGALLAPHPRAKPPGYQAGPFSGGLIQGCGSSPRLQPTPSTPGAVPWPRLAGSRPFSLRPPGAKVRSRSRAAQTGPADGNFPYGQTFYIP